MALKLRSPKKEIEKLFENFMDDPFQSLFLRRFPALKDWEKAESYFPSLDMIDNKNEIVIKAEVPGVKKQDIKISLSDDLLTIKGELKEEKDVKEEDYFFSERVKGTFTRSVRVPVKVLGNKVKANFKDGILEIKLPKAKESKPKEIKVEVKD